MPLHPLSDQEYTEDFSLLALGELSCWWAQLLPICRQPSSKQIKLKKKKKKPEPRKLGCGQIPRHHTENHLMIYVAWLTARGQVNKMCRLPRPAAKEQARCDCPQRLPKARRGQAEQRGAELHLQCSGGLCSSVQASRLRNANFLLIGNSSDSCA